MRLRQPDVQRKQPCFRAEPEQREKECNARPVPGERHGAHRVERIVAASALQHAEAQQDADRTDVRDQQVEKAGSPDVRQAMLSRDEEV